MRNMGHQSVGRKIDEVIEYLEVPFLSCSEPVDVLLGVELRFQLENAFGELRAFVYAFANCRSKTRLLERRFAAKTEELLVGGEVQCCHLPFVVLLFEELEGFSPKHRAIVGEQFENTSPDDCRIRHLRCSQVGESLADNHTGECRVSPRNAYL